MQVALDSAKYEIIFQHNPKLRASSCVVMKDGNIMGSALVGEQSTACFSKNCGRKKALAQAIKRLPVSDRYEIWNHHYRTMTDTPRWPAQKMTDELYHRLMLRESNRLKEELEFKQARLQKKLKRQALLERSSPLLQQLSERANAEEVKVVQLASSTKSYSRMVASSKRKAKKRK